MKSEARLRASLVHDAVRAECPGREPPSRPKQLAQAVLFAGTDAARRFSCDRSTCTRAPEILVRCLYRARIVPAFAEVDRFSLTEIALLDRWYLNDPAAATDLLLDCLARPDWHGRRSMISRQVKDAQSRAACWLSYRPDTAKPMGSPDLDQVRRQKLPVDDLARDAAAGASQFDAMAAHFAGIGSLPLYLDRMIGGLLDALAANDGANADSIATIFDRYRGHSDLFDATTLVLRGHGERLYPRAQGAFRLLPKTGSPAAVDLGTALLNELARRDLMPRPNPHSSRDPMARVASPWLHARIRGEEQFRRLWPVRAVPTHPVNRLSMSRMRSHRDGQA